MIDFIKSINLSDEIKTNELYNLFKTDSLEFNLNILSSLQKFKTMNDLFINYIHIDFKNAFDSFNNLLLFSSQIWEDTEKKNIKSEIEKYLYGLSKIIFFFILIQKSNELLSNLLTNIKKYIKRFITENRYKSTLKDKLNSYLNDLTCSSQITSKRNYSRRSTKENTISPTFIYHNFGKTQENEIDSNEGEYFTFQCYTPKFEEEDDEDVITRVNEEKSCFNNIILSKNGEETKLNSKKSIESIGSSLSFRHMKFTYDSDDDNKRNNKKNKTMKIEMDVSNPKNFFKKKSISNKINQNSYDKSDSEEEQLEKTKILAKFLNIINSIYKKGIINTKQKIDTKQLIISDSENLIEKYSKFIINNKCDKKYDKKYIKKFLIEQIKFLK